MIGREVLAALLAAVAASSLAGLIVRPTARLAPRVRPYTVGTRTALGGAPEVLGVGIPGAEQGSGTIRRLFWPPVSRLARAFAGVVDRRTSEEQLLLKLRRAGMYQGTPAELRVQEYRIRQLGSAVLWATTSMASIGALGRSPAAVMGGGALGLAVGAGRFRGRVDGAIERRRERMRIELYTVNQLLAMHLRAGGGVMQAIRHVVRRGRGIAVEELAEVLRAVEAGAAPAAALERQCSLSVEPAAARTYRGHCCVA